MVLSLPFGSFSPVAGIQWVETQSIFNGDRLFWSFSPVAGIQWVETNGSMGMEQRRIGVSVPLPGFSGLRPLKQINPQ